MTALYSDPSFLGDIRLAEDTAARSRSHPDGRRCGRIPRLDGMQAAADRRRDATRHTDRFALQGEHGIGHLSPIDERLVAVAFDRPPIRRPSTGSGTRCTSSTSPTDQTISEVDLGDAYVGDMPVSPDGTQLAVTTMVWDSPATPEVEARVSHR